MTSDVICYLHALSNLSWIRIHQFLWLFFIGKVKCTKHNSKTLNKPRGILKISVFKRLGIVNLLIGAKIK